MSGEKSATQIAPVESPQMVSTVKLLILKKGEYTFWSMRMEQYLTNINYSLWQVILNGDGLIQVTTNENGVKTELSTEIPGKKGYQVSEGGYSRVDFEGAILQGNVEHQEIKGTGMEMQGIRAGTTSEGLLPDEPSLESVEAQLVVHQNNEAVYEEKIAVLEFEVKDKSNAVVRLKNYQLSAKNKIGLGYGDQLNENDSSGSELFNSVFNSRSSDEMTIKQMIGLDDSVYRPTTNKTSANVSQVETSTSQTRNTSVEMPRVESVRPNKPRFKRIEFTNARNESVKPKQADKPRIITQNPKVDRRDWNGQMTQKLGLGFGFTKKACFVCGSYSHLIKDYDFHEKIMAKKSVLKNMGKNSVLTRFGRVAVSAAKQSSLRATTSTSTFRPVNTATHTNRVNVSKLKTNAFHKSHSPIRSFYKSTAPNTRISNEKVNTVRVNGVNTVGQIVVSTVKGTGVTVVKASSGCVWRPKMTDLNNVSKDNSGSWVSKRVNYIDPQGRLKHMTRNKDFLTDYQDIDGGFVAFGGSARGDRASRPEEPRKSPAVPLTPQEQKRENHGSPNKEALQSSRQILEEDKMSSVRLEKLKLVEKEFADELNKHEKLRPVVVNDEISLNRPANETQILDLVESEKEDQESREVAPALLGNPIEAESRDKRVHDLSPVVVPDVVVNLGETSNDVVSGSHTALSEPIGDIPAKHVADMGNDVAGADAIEDPTGTGPHHGAPNVESAELAIPAGNCNQDKAQDTTPSVQQVASPVSDHSMPAIPSFQEIHNDSNLLQQPSENGIQDQEGQADPTPTVETTAEDSSLNPHDEPSSVISTDPTITENQAAMSSTSEVLVQTTAPPITAQAQIQLGQYLFDLQRNANFNQAASLRTGGVDPLHIELLQLSSVRDKMVKSHHDNIQKINIDYQKERTEAIAELRLKYNNKRQEADATYNSQKKEVENNMNTVVMNQLLAACFRRKCQDASGGYAAVQQARQAESMQQQRRFRDAQDLSSPSISNAFYSESTTSHVAFRRMKQYECLTNDSSLAAAIFVPFYAGFDAAKYLWGYNISVRDAASNDLVEWTASTPIETNKALTKDEDGEDVDVHLYRSMIRSLMYLTSSRLDIMFFVYACSRFQVQPKVSHLNAVKMIFRYLKGRPNLGLWYPKDSPLILEAFSDSDYAGASLDRKSTTGGCQFLGSRLISWQCKKQTVVANSTTKAKYIAASHCCGQVLWIQNQMLDYGYNFMQTKIHVDNESAICVVKNPVYHSKTKHIEIRHHFIRDSYEKKLIKMVKIRTDNNVADLLTKAFDVSRFNFMVASICMLNL
ncbi:hypothetical protein Tco_1335523 [Tanacetum coccineum]